MVFLCKCLPNNVTPKSFRLRAPIKTTKCENMKELRRKLLAHTQNETKRRLHESKNYEYQKEQTSFERKVSTTEK